VLAIEAELQLVQTPVTEVSAISVTGFECEYSEYALADLSDTSAFKNDTSTFLLTKSLDTDTIVFSIWKDGFKISDITDNTYGTYYSTFTQQPLYAAFVVEWRKVLTLEGSGCYKIKANQNILGVQTLFESRNFKLLPYSDFAAQGTVRIETYQNGNIQRSNFDYTNLIDGGWKQSYRFEGFFGFKTPVLNVDSYFDSNYTLEQIQTSNTQEYTLETKILPPNISNALTEDNILADRIVINDYNSNNSNLFRDLEVMPQSFEDTIHANDKKGTIYRIKFVDKVDDLRKRRF
jgi:hypothetical protein